MCSNVLKYSIPRQIISITFRFFLQNKWLASLCSGVGIFMWSMAYLQDIKNNLNAINEIAKCKHLRLELRSKFLDTIHHHSVGIELSIGGLETAQIWEHGDSWKCKLSIVFADFWITLRTLLNPFSCYSLHGAWSQYADLCWLWTPK